MKFDPQSDQWQDRIDDALRSAGASTPPAGLEGRILTRLAAARVADAQASRLARWPRYSLPLAGFAAAGLMCAVIVVGSVEHVRGRTHHAPAPPVLVLPGQGMGAASAVHTAAPASAPLAAGPGEHGRSTRRLSHARAHIAPNARKAHGVGVPAPAPQP
jgi:negative regulator of sigma E activity